MMLTAWQASSQNGIQNDSVVISKDIARKVLIDLADYDRLRENKVEANLKNCIEIQKEKDTLINYMSQQNKFFRERILLSEKQLKIKETQIGTVKNNSGKNFLFAGAGLVVGFVLGFIAAP